MKANTPVVVGGRYAARNNSKARLMVLATNEKGYALTIRESDWDKFQNTDRQINVTPEVISFDNLEEIA